MMAGMDRPAILVADLEGALAAAKAAAAARIPIYLLSERDGSLVAGVGWYFGLLRAINRRAPGGRVTFIVDCGNRPDHAQAAFRLGMDVVFRGPERIAIKLASIAEKSQRILLQRRPRPLPVADSRDPAAIAEALLRHQSRSRRRAS